MQKRILIQGPIGETTAPNGEKMPGYSFTDLASAIKEGREEGATSFVFAIDSVGGSVNEGFLMAAYIESLPEPTVAEAIRVFSIATVIYFSADERTGSDDSVFMLHNAITTATGNAQDFRFVADYIERESERIQNYVAARTGLDPEALRGLSGTDRFINYAEAEELGFFGSRPSAKLAALYVANQSYTDYPQEASELARRALAWLEENDNPNNCLTAVGFARANQLANREPLSEDTLERVASFLARAEEYKDTPYSEGCGKIAWDAWGGEPMQNWVNSKLSQIQNTMKAKQEASLLAKIKSILNMTPEEETPQEEPVDMAKAMEEKDAIIAELQAKIQEMEAELAKYQTETAAEAENNMAIEAKLQELTQSMELIARNISSGAKAMNHLPTFNATPGKPEEKAEELSDAVKALREKMANRYGGSDRQVFHKK